MFKQRSEFSILALILLLTIVGTAVVACGVESGDRRSARSTPLTVFDTRQTGSAITDVRVDFSKDDSGKCVGAGADFEGSQGDRVRLLVQLTGQGISQGSTGSLNVTGERDSVTYVIPGLEINSPVGLSPGTTSIDVVLQAGTRTNYSFNLTNAGTFDVLCDGNKVGTFNVAASSG